MTRRHLIPLPRAVLVIGVVGSALVGAEAAARPALPVGSSAAGGPPAPTAFATGAARKAQAATPTPTPASTTPSPTPTATPEPLSAKERRTRDKAQALAASLADDLSGFSRADVRRGVPVTFSLGTGRALVRLQVRIGERWANVARLQLPRGKGKRTMRAGKQGLKRLASASVERDRVQARYAVSLSDGNIDASAWKSFRLNR